MSYNANVNKNMVLSLSAFTIFNYVMGCVLNAHLIVFTPTYQ